MLRYRDDPHKEQFIIARNKHVGNIRKAKKAIWVRFVENPEITNRNMWGNLTKWITHEKCETRLPAVLRKCDGTYTTNVQDTAHIHGQFTNHKLYI